MGRRKEPENVQVNVLLSSLEKRAIDLMGGPTAVIKSVIEARAGTVFKLKQMREQSFLVIEREQAKIAELDSLIKDTEEKMKRDAEEAEKKRLQQSKDTHPGKNIDPVKLERIKISEKENWINSQKSKFLEFYNNGGLSDQNYALIRQYKNFRTNEEVEGWLKS